MFSPPANLLIPQLAFVFAIAMILFIYLGYPLLMFVLRVLIPRPVRRTDIQPRVSLIIAAYNEEKDIAAKLENALALDYPKELLEIIVASDCSSDQTDEIVRGFADRGVILHRQEERHGKTRAQYRAVTISSGEVLLFSDATTMYEPDTLHKVLRNFADPTVGCVAGQLVYTSGQNTAVGKGCSSYWNYEKLLKSWESKVGSLIGVSGCLYAVRRSCQARLAPDMIDDFVIATEIHLQGLRTIYEPEAVSVEETNTRSKDEFRMRVRVIEQTIRALYHYREVLDIRRHGMFAFQLICHKVLRYTVPAFMVLALIANWFALDAGDFYRVTFATQVLGYSAAVLGWLGDRAQVKLGPLSIPYYFMLVNVAVLVAFLKFMRGESHVVWEPTRNARPVTAEKAAAEKPNEVLVAN